MNKLKPKFRTIFGDNERKKRKRNIEPPYIEYRETQGQVFSAQLKCASPLLGFASSSGVCLDKRTHVCECARDRSFLLGLKSPSVPRVRGSLSLSLSPKHIPTTQRRPSFPIPPSRRNGLARYSRQQQLPRFANPRCETISLARQ